jgi:hypothetical protein
MHKGNFREITIHKVNINMHNNQNNHINGKFQIEERRRKVAALHNL